jgi:hypothetical protein
MILYLISIILCGAAGSWIAVKAELPEGRIVGALIGAILNLFGVVFLLGIWGAEWVETQLESRLGKGAR